MNKTLAITAILLLAGTVHATTTPPARPGVMRQMRGNIEQNKDVRNTIRIEKREAVGTGTPRMMGTTTRLNNPLMQKREVRPTAPKGAALAQKEMLVKRLTLVLENLTKAKTNLSTYIDKRVADGKPIGNAKELLATFSAKLEVAKKAVAAVVAWKPDTKTASTTEISLTKPRETANAAIKAVNEARVAFQAVVVELRAQAKTATNNQ